VDTNRFTTALRTTQEARDALKRRRIHLAEFRAFCSGGTMVFIGLLLAALYGLLTHQISN
jgi:hypothetical protein